MVALTTKPQYINCQVWLNCTFLLEERITGKPFSHKKWSTFIDLRQCIKRENWEALFLRRGSVDQYVTSSVNVYYFSLESKLV